MQFPDSFLVVIREKTNRYGSDIAKAVEESEKALRKLPEFESQIEAMVTNAIRDLVYDERHVINVKLKRESGRYNNESTMKGLDPSIVKVHQSLYEYFIAGTTLGDLYGKQLSQIADNENAIAEGHQFNAGLCNWLRKVVPDEKQVKQVVSEKQLRNIFSKVKEEIRAA